MIIQKSKQEVEQQGREKVILELILIRKDLNKLGSKLDLLFDSIERKQPSVTAEVLNVLHGIHRDLLMAMENIKRIDRILFKKSNL
ncbi:MAG: hypothetical protein RSA51_09035 [Niameybacter sp.]